MEKEIYKPVVGYEGLYEVSNYGNVKSIATSYNHPQGIMRINPRILKQQKAKAGYMKVILTQETKHKTMLVHRLVALAFINNPNNKPIVNHIDGNKCNNHVNNLEWVTHSENNFHAVKIGRMPKGENHHKSVLKQNDVISIFNRMKAGESSGKLSKEYSVAQSQINAIANKTTWKHITAGL